MRFVRRGTPGLGPHTVIDVFLIAFGILLLLGIIPLPEVSFFHGFVLAIVGILMVAVPTAMVRRIGFMTLLLGAYIVFRNVGFISTEYLRYGFACFLILAGSVSIAHDVMSEPTDTDLDKEGSL